MSYSLDGFGRLRRFTVVPCVRGGMSYHSREPGHHSDIDDGGLLLLHRFAGMGARGGCGTANPLPESAGEREQGGADQDQQRQWQSGFLHKAVPPSKGNFSVVGKFGVAAASLSVN
jgi:hypothetical protein